MRYVMWILKFALFVLVLAFAIKNADLVTVRYFPGVEWQAPLVFVLLVAFCLGIVAGLGAGLPQVFRQRREIAGLRRELERIRQGSAEHPRVNRAEGSLA
jgi:uncharacterized integral membrane protein